ncbi:hydroxyacid dehydrogenase [Pararhizobium sp. A13]|uniref:hydroxyacid dehydrogenase n=1 Tax=Pararhizobium sp. A13 TaxID=3133975 RepID=UPI00311B43C6
MKRPAIALAMLPERTQHVLPPELLARLDQLGVLLDPTPMTTFTGDRARRLLAETEILVTGWGAPLFDANALASTPNLRLVAHAAGTVKGIVGPWVFDGGVRVTHAAQANALPVAEFTLAAIIFAGKSVFRFRDLYVAHRDRTLTHPLQAEPIGNYRRVVGIVGASRIGRRVIELLRPFDYEILLYDPMVTEGEAGDLRVEKVDLDTLFRRADIVSLHAPSLPQTRHMVDARRLSLMKDGGTLINTARGALIDEDALLAALKTGVIDAVIDVTDPEIPGRSSPFYDLPNVFLTPHIAGAIGMERARLGETVIDEIARFIDGRPLRYEVRAQDLERMA